METYDYGAFILDICRMKKPKLVRMVKDAAAKRGQSWLIGGPDDWSRDELIAALARVVKGGEL
jgi:hypothetical protein